MEDLWPTATSKSHLKGFSAEFSAKAVGEFPAEHMAGIEIHDRCKAVLRIPMGTEKPSTRNRTAGKPWSLRLHHRHGAEPAGLEPARPEVDTLSRDQAGLFYGATAAAIEDHDPLGIGSIVASGIDVHIRRRISQQGVEDAISRKARDTTEAARPTQGVKDAPPRRTARSLPPGAGRGGRVLAVAMGTDRT